MNAAAQRRLTAPLALVVLLLGVLFLALLAGIGRGVRWAPPRPAAPLPAQRAATLPPPVPLQHFAPVWQQPLFNPDRKPQAHAVGGGGGQLGDMQLTGIILTPDLHMALLHNKRGGDKDQDLRVREGASLPDGSWTLVEVRPRSAVFDSSSGRVELQLPAGAPLQAQPAPGADASGEGAIPNELPGDNEPPHTLQPPPEKGEDNPADNPADQPGEPPADQPAATPEPAAAQSGDGGASGGDASAPRGDAAASDTSNEARQADRLRLLKAAIEKRRAEQAAAKAHEGDR